MTGLVKAIDKFVDENKEKRAASYVVLLDENSPASQAKLAEFAKKEGISTPLTIALEGAQGPGAYKLKAEVPITVLVVRKNKVVANFALAASADAEGRKKEVADILAAAANALPK